MFVKHFTKILWVCGLITMLPILMFFIPWTMFSLTGIDVGRQLGVPFIKHWGLMAFCFGGLLVYAATHPEVRRPIVIFAGVEKLGLCVIIAMGWSEPFMAPLHATLFVDGAMVILFGLYLLSGGEPERRREASQFSRLP